MREQHPEGVAAGGVDLLRELVRRFLIGVAVRIVDACEHDGITVAHKIRKLVGEHRHAALLQRALDLLHDLCAVTPLVVACDVIRRCDGRERRADLAGVDGRVLGLAVDQVARHEDILRMRGLDRTVQALVALAEVFAMQIAELHDAAAVKARRQRA